jgi:chitodextrinase
MNKINISNFGRLRIFVTFLILGSTLPVIASAQTVSLSPVSATLEQNQPFTVDVTVSDMTDLFGLGFDLLFDPNLIQFVNATDGGFLSQNANAPILTAVNPPGDLIFSQGRLGAASGAVNGSGMIAHLNFRTRSQDGTSNLNFSQGAICKLVGSTCSYVTGSWNNGSVVISTPDTTPPSSPSGLAATAVLANSIDLGWSVSTDNISVAGYKIFQNDVQVATVIGTTYQATGLAPNTSYTFKIKATDAAGNDSADSNLISVTTRTLPDSTAPTVPANLHLVSATVSRINLAWSASADPTSAIEETSGVAGYMVYRDNVYLMTVVSPVYYNENLPAGTSYSYQVSAVDAAGNESARSGAVSAATLAPADITAPIIIIISPTTGQTYTTSNDTLNLSGTATDNVGIVGYGYSNTYDGGGVSGGPGGLSPRASVNWNFVVNLQPGINTITVSAGDAAGNTGTDVITVTYNAPDTVAPSVPANLSINTISSSQINLSWNASTDNVAVAGYNIYRNSAFLISVTGTTFQNTGLLPATSYSYQISAVDTTGNESARTSAVSATTRNLPDSTAPSVPANLHLVSATVSQINMAWNSSTDPSTGSGQVSGVAGYKVYRNDVYMMTVVTLAYYNAGLPAGTTYSYQVSAVDAAGNESARSAALSASTLTVAQVDKTAPTIPTGLRASLSAATTVNLNWYAASDYSSGGIPASGVAGYRIFRNNNWVANVTSLSYSDSALAKATTYIYQVVSYDNAGNESVKSNSVQIATSGTDRTKPNPPGGLKKKKGTSSSIEIGWNAAIDPSSYLAPASGVTGYKIFRNGSYINSTAALSYEDGNLTPKTTYRYQVSALDAAGNESALSGTLYAATELSPDTSAPNAPSNLRVRYDLYYYPQDVSLSWYSSRDNRSGTLKYNIYRNGEFIISTTRTSYSQKLTDYGIYQYQIKAVDVAGNESAGSNTVTVNYIKDTTAPGAPTNLRITYNLYYHPTDVRLYWSHSHDERPGTLRYNIYRNGGFVASTTRTSFFQKLTDYGTYQYQIKAVDKIGNESAGSNTVTADYIKDTTAPGVPANLKVSYNLYYHPTDVRLYWSHSHDERPGTVKYNIYRNGGFVASTTRTSFFQKLTDYGIYQYQIKAVDVTGNESAGSSMVMVNYRKDTTAPNVPANFKFYQDYRDKSIVRAYWSRAKDDWPGTIKYNVYRNGIKAYTTSRTSFYEKLAVKGSYQYQISATDVAGNESARSAAVTIVW